MLTDYRKVLHPSGMGGREGNLVWGWEKNELHGYFRSSMCLLKTIVVVLMGLNKSTLSSTEFRYCTR